MTDFNKTSGDGAGAVRLYIAVPSCRDWKVQFGASFMGLIHHTMNARLGGRLEAIYLNAMAGASILSRARELALREAIAKNYTHILMLDDDMTFPYDTLERLLAHNKPFVAANYRTKIPDKIKSVCFALNGENLDSSGKSGLEEVSFVGAGINLLDLSVISSVPEPRFEVLWDDNRKDYWGEDMYFCNKLRSHGIPVLVDHDLSQHVAHLGDYPYRFAVSDAIKEMNETLRKVM